MALWPPHEEAASTPLSGPLAIGGSVKMRRLVCPSLSIRVGPVLRQGEAHPRLRARRQRPGIGGIRRALDALPPLADRGNHLLAQGPLLFALAQFRC